MFEYFCLPQIIKIKDKKIFEMVTEWSSHSCSRRYRADMRTKIKIIISQGSV
jgi:hypothetical protein